MPNVCVLLANGFEELEATALVDVLRRAGVSVTTLGVEGREVTGAHGLALRADALLSEARHRPWDMVILPGGMPGAATLKDNAAVQELLKAQNAAGKRLAAICAAPMALAKAGVLSGKRATCYPGTEPELAGATLSEERVVHDGNVFTSRGPGTAVEFALALVSDLVGHEEAAALRRQMLV